MNNRNFRELLERRWSLGNFVCVGLDSEFRRIPQSVRFSHSDSQNWASVSGSVVAFNRAIVNATHDIVCAYKINPAFYEEHGSEGLMALEDTFKLIRIRAPQVPVIFDNKTGDTKHSNEAYARKAFDLLRADAVTVQSYVGAEALEPFLTRADKGIFVICRTSNNGAGEFQDMEIMTRRVMGRAVPLYQYVAMRVTKKWNKHRNCGLVVGAMYSKELQAVRHTVGDMPLLIPGFGKQGGDVKEATVMGKDSRGQGIIMSSSRSIIFASKEADFAEAARRETEKLHESIKKFL